jgi:hypothetical protein
VANEVKLTFGGDADQLVAASRRAARATEEVGASTSAAGDDFERAAGQSRGFEERAGRLGAAVDGASTAIGDAAGTMQALADITSYSERRAQEHARALNDLAQAQNDVNQAAVDGKQAIRDVAQANLDAEQALLDADTAQAEYNAAVAEHGKNSAEARQADIDRKQAAEDLAQANLDVEQAQVDVTQATIDATDAQLNANEAMVAANPPDLQVWADQLNLVAPLLQGVVGVVALVTAAQWAWNIAQLASPTTWIILGIVALIAVIVLIAAKTDWFSKAWRASWDWIKKAASNTWDFIKKIPGWTADAFKNIAKVISWPYRTAFNLIADAWNHTVGALSFTFPSWIPGIGGNSINVPDLPKFHSGGRVPGQAGSEMLAVLQAGEEVIPAGGGGASTEIVIRSGGTALDDLLVEILAGAMRARNGDPRALGLRVARG